ncbi:myogenesis-regulating glycosidase-like [Branchiostoma lanceolatum]|uniref:myogenesis-regulating glycosidase-like n=1 Tax=Branchiostoma lanceolatum TaxID=7740 RepID=UPI003455C119
MAGDDNDSDNRRKTKTLYFMAGGVAAVVAIAVRLLAVYLAPQSTRVVIKNARFSTDTRTFSLQHEGKVTIRGQLGLGLPSHQPPTELECGTGEQCYKWPMATVVIKAEELESAECYTVSWEAVDDIYDPMDCLDLSPAHWYGGAEMYYQGWPIEKWNKSMTFYLSGDMYASLEEWGSVMERYWLSSEGVGVTVAETVPLHVSVNHMNDGQLCFKAAYKDSPYQNINKVRPKLEYTICQAGDVKAAQQFMMNRFYGKPRGKPDERMVRSPIWSTWAQFHTNISHDIILQFADDIQSHGFSNSQLEIDDGWSVYYGDDFDDRRFPNPRQMVDVLKNKGFRVTLWTHPFANLDSDMFREIFEKRYLAGMVSGGCHTGLAPAVIRWWNGIGSIVDMTNPAATAWFKERLRKLQQDYGIDSFKFDGGEALYLPFNFVVARPLAMDNKNTYTTLYADFAAEFGPMAEVRAAYRNQEVPMFVRMMDKDSHWGYDKGLKTLIPTALTFSILGYPFILPDMIGGNGYDGVYPVRELFIRWLEVTAFLPSMQFSIVPWQYDQEVVDLARRYTELHETIVAPLILRYADEAVATGDPIIRPLWWLAPQDETSLTIDSEFLIGDELLAAPVLDQGATARDVYLPPGHRCCIIY